MNIKRYLLASAAVFILFQITGYIVHGLLLMKTYESLSALWRPDMMSLMWMMHITGAVYTLTFMYIYTRWRRTGNIAEALAYGAVIALFMNLTGVVNQHVVFPVPLALTVQWLVYGSVEIFLGAIVAALVYRPKA
ncbi:MAG TPA: hypothetical protein VLM75_11615 [Spirochaetota bacterium]|nr:hypothetical protein [Spirochaetota bacterium]